MQVLPFTVPTIWHVDGAEMRANKETTHFSLQSVLARGSSWDVKMLCVSLPNALMPSKAIKRHVHINVAEFAAYMYFWLALGVHPTHGFYKEKFDPESDRGKKAGTPFAGGFRFVFCGKKGDSKARMESNLFARHYQTTLLCEECCAVQPFPRAPKELTYMDARATAKHRLTKVSHEMYMANAKEVSPWSVVLGWRLELEFRDTMHAGPLGLLRDLIASGLNDLLEEGSLGEGDPDTLLREQFVKMNEFFGDDPIYGAPVFSLNMLGVDVKKNSPCMSSLYKAANLNKMCYYFTALFNEHATTVKGQLRASCMWGYTSWMHVLRHSPLVGSCVGRSLKQYKHC